MGRQESQEYKERLKEMTGVLRKHNITRGVSPEKLRLILEDLGPTFIKLGQIMSMHSDILPKRYCDELMRLRSEVAPMSFSEVEEVLREAYGCPWKEIFKKIEELPLGSASIAQVHKAVLRDGEEVVVKIQRKGIYDKMARDIGLLHRAVKLLPPVSLKGMVDLDMVLDELWAVTREEMNFLTEASNLEEFARRNKDIVFVGAPKMYHEYTNRYVLVMEYIDGFFHADPHPGNVKIRGGKIIWIDMGMMGRLTERDRELIGNAVEGIAMSDIGMIQDAVMALGDFKEPPDQSCLYEGISNLLSQYGTADMGSIDIAKVTMSLMEVMKENKIIMPHGLTMLARGLTHMEGVLADIAPELNMVEIASRHMAGKMLKEKDWKQELKNGGKTIYRSFHKAINIPSLISDILQGYLKGQTKINLDLHASMELERLLRRLVRNVVMGLWVMALLISSSIICTTNMKPKIWGIPALGAFGYLIAFAIVMYVFLKHIFSRK